MKHPLALLTLCGTLLLGACSWNAAPADSASSSSSSSETVIRDVSYTGVIRELGVSIYMQGTHKLDLDNGQFVILESSTLDLNNYLDRAVRVTGDIRPTVEEGGMIMRVDSVSAVETSSDSSESSDTSDSASSMEISSASSALSVATVSSRQASSVRVASSAPAASSAVTDANLLKAQTMAKANMGAANWTQQYCSKQIGFCAPVHKNWWFVSFGATSTYLAHVEVGPEELNALGDGPLAINVVAGSIGTSGKSDGQISADGSDTVGYRAWSNDRHIEVRGPSVLAEAIRYMTQNIAAAPVQ